MNFIENKKRLLYFIMFFLISTYATNLNAYIEESDFKAYLGGIFGACVGNRIASLVANRITTGHWVFNNYSSAISGYERSCFYFATAATIASAYAGYKLIYRITPQGRAQRAREIINSIDKEMIHEALIEDSALFLVKMNNKWIISPFPLASAYDSYVESYVKLTNAQELLILAKQDEKESSRLACECNHDLQLCLKYLSAIAHALTRLKACPDFIAQLDAKRAHESYKIQDEMLKEMQQQTWLQIINGR